MTGRANPEHSRIWLGGFPVGVALDKLTDDAHELFVA